MKVTKPIKELSFEEWKQLLDISKDLSKYLLKLTTEDNSLTLEAASYVVGSGSLAFLEFIWEAMKLDTTKLPEYMSELFNNIYKDFHKKKEN